MRLSKSIAYCHTCRKQRAYHRFFVGHEVCSICTSCGAEQKASYEPVNRGDAGMLCPGCHSSRKVQIEPGRWRCLECSSHFERPDTGYCDHRPVKNAQKNEARQRGKGR